MEWDIPLSDLDFGDEEEEAVLQVLKSRWLTMGEKTSNFENMFAEFHNATHAIAVSSCTAALHLACIALDIKAGDEVILPSLSFVATANAVKYAGATPIFADIVSEDDLTISPASIQDRISPKTRAIIVMHYAGYPCDMLAIMALAQEHGLAVIEDNAHGLGASLNGKSLGTWGHIGCFSFFSNKNLVTGEGGMLVTENQEVAERVKRLRSHGMTSLTWDRHLGHQWSYDVVELGYNYRLDEIRSVLGQIQLKKLERNNEIRRNLVVEYRTELSRIADLEIPFKDHPGISSAHIMPVLVPIGIDRVSVMEDMKKAGIQTSMHYPPIHSFSSYSENRPKHGELPVTESVSSRELTLPLFPTMKPEQVLKIVKSLGKSINESVKH